MTTPNMIGDAPLHPDCFTRMCVAALVENAPKWRWVPYLGWTFDDGPGTRAPQPMY